MEENTNQSSQTGIGQDSFGQATSSQNATVNQDSPQDLNVSPQPESPQNLGGTIPTATPPDISSVVTTTLGDKKSKKTTWVILGIMLLIAVSIGGYFIYTGFIEKQGDSDQTLTTLPSPILLATSTPGLPTVTPIPEATGSAMINFCEEIFEQATQSAHQLNYCDGTFCKDIEIEEECLKVDVVATSEGKLSSKQTSDGVGDCVWKTTSGFGSKCQIKY